MPDGVLIHLHPVFFDIAMKIDLSRLSGKLTLLYSSFIISVILSAQKWPQPDNISIANRSGPVALFLFIMPLSLRLKAL